MSHSLQPHGLEYLRLFHPSRSPRVCSNSCLLSWWCYLSLSSSVTLFSFCPQSFAASGSFPVNWLFASGGQSTGASTSISVLPVNIQGWFPLGLMVWSPCSPRDPQESSPAPHFKKHFTLFNPKMTLHNNTDYFPFTDKETSWDHLVSWEWTGDLNPKLPDLKPMLLSTR